MKLERKGGKQLTSDESKAIWMNLGYPTQLSACYLWLPLFTKVRSSFFQMQFPKRSQASARYGFYNTHSMESSLI
ncbi:hypothetical protein JHK87_055375 [Glycine soja]|nr:hypothetical protein JHK87_055375 [Glycine soja]